jgi:hypothetical protein
MDEISNIRREIYQIRESKITSTVVDNSSSQVISEQQRLITNYQREL